MVIHDVVGNIADPSVVRYDENEFGVCLEEEEAVVGGSWGWGRVMVGRSWDRGRVVEG